VDLVEFYNRLDKEVSTALGTKRSISSVSSDVYYELQNRKEISKEDIKKATEKYGLRNIESKQIDFLAKKLKRHGLVVKN
jgi:hypothetical protein